VPREGIVFPSGKNHVVRLTPVLGQSDEMFVRSVLVEVEAPDAEAAISLVRRIRQFQDPKQWTVEYSRAGLLR
jgi:hypothetical protein